jgi:membrane fusion protein (multidrug efflux system)
MAPTEEKAKIESLPSEQSKERNGEQDQDIASLPMYRKKRIVIPLFLFVIAVSIGVWYWYVTIRGYVSTDDAFIDGDRVSISSKMLGRITKEYVIEGDRVAKDELLVQLDDTDLKAQEAQGKTALELARRGVDPAKVALDRAQDDFNRAEVQFKGGIDTREQYDHAQKTLDAAHADYSLALSRVNNAEAQLQVTEVLLQNTKIFSPLDGAVAKRWVLQGDVVQAGQPIFSVYDTKDIWVTANFEETDLYAIHMSDSVEISVDAYPSKIFFGRVFQLGTYTASEFSLIPPNNASGNFTKVTQRVPVKISIDNPPTDSRLTPLLPGMSVEVRLKVR